MAQLLRVDGSIETVHPIHEQQWTEGELKALVGEYNSSRTASGDYLLHSDWTDLHEKLGKDSLTFEELCRWRPFNPTAAKATVTRENIHILTIAHFAEKNRHSPPAALRRNTLTLQRRTNPEL
jgi:hypothetical protein